MEAWSGLDPPPRKAAGSSRRVMRAHWGRYAPSSDAIDLLRRPSYVQALCLGDVEPCTAFLSNTRARQSRPQATGRPARVPMSIGLPASAGACAELAVIHGQCNPCARHRPSAPGP